jgi:undecaprenyl-diphosphatase
VGQKRTVTAGATRHVPPPQQADARFGSRALLAGLALLLVAVPFGLLLLFVRDRWGPLLEVDDGARDDLHGYAVAHPWFVSAMKTLSTAGSTPVYLTVFTAIVCWLVWRRQPRSALFVGVTMVGNALLNLAVKHAVERSRPVLPDPVATAGGLSFPSGHAQSAIAAYAVLLLLLLPRLPRTWRPVVLVVAVLMVLGIGASRVSLGVHYVSDVLAGYALGAAWVIAMVAAFDELRRGRGPARDKPPLSPEAG